MPLLETCVVAVNSPVLGLYRYLASPVYIVDTAPDVALANSGYKLVAVAVSLLMVAPLPDAAAQDAVVPLDVRT
jgi:hypothetical protein